MEILKEYITKYKQLILIITIVLVAVLGFLSVNASESEQPKEEISLIKNEIKEELPIEINVDIKGAVKNPGVYKMKKADRIIDVINKSGGLTENADTSITNLAYEVKDGLSFKIYTKEEVKKLLLPKEIITEKLICPTSSNTNCITTDITNIKDEGSNQSKTLVSINTGTLTELQTLSGVGPATAEKIIAYRLANGIFKSLEEIKDVSGIGDSLFDKIKDFITL